MAELLSVWVDDKITGLKKLRPKTLKSIRNMSNTFKTDFGMVRMKEIDHTGIEKYLSEKKVADQTRENIRSYLSQFFNWSIKKRCHDNNSADGIEIEVNKGSPGFFTVEQCQAMMRQALKDDHRSISAYFPPS
jgi:site-specific recombinase XerD